ncbi:MAG: NFACT family protein [Candidatus Gastranaerophilales bacterium]|nr:NFACT family protein [Candidatus Gastranaerophilales bacterium]
MISLDYITLKAFFEENRGFFCGARLQKIQQPTRRDFILTIRGRSETRKLYINIDPQVCHLCFINDNTAAKRHITIPQKPPMFCMLLRKHLEGFRICRVNVPVYERIFEIYFEAYDELNEMINFCLAIELMGKYSNVILYNNSSKTIIGCAHNVGAEKSRDRELSGTLPYTYPPKQNKSDILRYFGEVHYECLNDDFLGISKSFQTLLEENSAPLERIKDFVELKSPLNPAIDGNFYSVYSELLKNPQMQNNVNSMIDNYYSCIQERIMQRALRLKLKNIILPKIKKQENSLLKLHSQSEKKDNAQKYKKYADLIISNLYNNNDYTDKISVFDWNTNKQITISLDKTKTLKENAGIYYQLYSKSKNSREKLALLEKDAADQLEYFNQILYTIENANSVELLYEILSECEEFITIKNVHRDKKKTKTINVEETLINGYRVYIGRNNRQNDLIVSKLSSANDYWFHTQNCTGSHILLKVTGKTEPDENTIYECCKLAKKFSSASASTKIGVIYTKRKYLKKPPKSNLGYVTYKNEKEIIVSD